jgi:hypothetical protein
LPFACQDVSLTTHHAYNDARTQLVQCGSVKPNGYLFGLWGYRDNCGIQPNTTQFENRLHRRQADRRERDARYRAAKRLQNPDWKPQHRLREVDLVTMTGICSVCGPTEVLRRTRGRVFYLCMKKLAADARARYGDDYVYKPGTRHPAFLPRATREPQAH